MTAKIVDNKTTKYSLLLPCNPDFFEQYASDKLNEYIKKSAGVVFPIQKEGESLCDKFISIGKTDALKKANLSANFGKDGYRIKEVDGNVYLFGESVNSIIWAVFELLEQKIGYKFYAIDEIKYQKVDSIDLTGIDFSYTPSVSNRASGFGVRNDREYATGLKAYTWYGERVDGKQFWGSWAHNHTSQFIKPSVYYKDHPDWFFVNENSFKPDGTPIANKMQLCLSNMEMRDEFFKNLVKVIQENDHATHFILGHEDQGYFCDCENCKKITDRITPSGLNMQFTNDMARRVEKWRKENCPDREIAIGTFAYSLHSSLIPPVKEENGEIVPIDPSVVAEPNVFITFAPISMLDHARSIVDPCNTGIKKLFECWKKICKRCSIWLYFGSFRRCFQFIDGIYAFKDNINYLKDMGMEHYYVESPNAKGGIVLQKMHLFVNTSLAFNSNLDTDELIDEFCDNYYKCASSKIKEFFHYYMDYFEKTRKRIHAFTGEEYHYGMCQTDYMPEGFWSLNAVYDMENILQEGISLIKSSDYDDDTKQKLIGRVDFETIALDYIKLEFYTTWIDNYEEEQRQNAFPRLKALKLVREFEEKLQKYGCSWLSDHLTIPEKAKNWKKRINYTGRGWENLVKDRIKLFKEAIKKI